MIWLVARRHFGSLRWRLLISAVGASLGALLIVVTALIGSGFRNKVVSDASFGGGRSMLLSAGTQSTLSYHFLPMFDDAAVAAVAHTSGVSTVAPAELIDSSTDPVVVDAGAKRVPVFSSVLRVGRPFFTINALAATQGTPAVAGSGVVVGAAFASRFHLHAGGTLVLGRLNSAKRITLTVQSVLTSIPQGVFGSRSQLNSYIFLPLGGTGVPALPDEGGTHTYSAIFAQSTSASSVGSVGSTLVHELSRRPAVAAALNSNDENLIVISTATLSTVANSFTGEISLFLLVIAGIAILLGGAAAGNAVLSSVLERERDFALMWAIGVRRKALRRVIRAQALILSLLGSIIGSALGIAVGLGVSAALGYHPGLTLLPFVEAVVVSLVVVQLVSIAPARRVTRSNIRLLFNG